MTAAELDRANAFLQANQPGLAGPLVARVLADNPDDVRATLLMARCLIELGDAGEAVSLAEHATTLRPDDAEAWAVLCVASMAGGLPALARVGAATARRLDPQSAYFAMLAAESTAWAGQAGRETIATARDAIRLAPGDPDPLVTLGSVYLSLDKVRPAVRAFREALAIDPQHVGARARLADIALTAGDLGRSTRGWAELLVEFPSNEYRLENLRISAEQVLLDLQVLLWFGFIPSLVVPQLPISLALGVLFVLGNLLWLRLRGGGRLAGYAAAMARMDRLWMLWACGLGATLVGFAVIPVFSGDAQAVAVAVTGWVTLLSSLLGVARLIFK